MAAQPGGTEKARFVRGMFDAIAVRYDVMNRLMTAGRDEVWRRVAADAVYPEVVRVAIDVGAGTGDLSFALARLAPQARVLATDFSPGMLALTALKRQREPAGARVLPVLGDAMRLPVDDAAVDAVVTGFTLRNVADLATVLGEFGRVIRPGGRVAVLELTPLRRSPLPGFRRLFDLYFDAIVPVLGGLVSGRGFAYRYLPKSVKTFPDAEALSEMLCRAGFAHVGYRLFGLGTVALHTGTKPAHVPGAAGTATGDTSGPPAAGGEGQRSTAVENPPAACAGSGAAQLRERRIDAGAEWNALLRSVPNAHILQSWEWGDLKRETGWVPVRLAFERGGDVAAASVSRRPLPGTRLGVAYCQKGPALDYANTDLFRDVLTRLAAFAREQRCVFVKVDPDVEASQTEAVAVLREAGYVPAAEQVQTRSTVVNDLRPPEDDQLRAMSATWRRYINRAKREGVTIRHGTGADLDRFYALYQETAARDGFIIRPRTYYESAWRRLHAAGLAELILAEVDGVAEGAVVACALGRRAWYLWGATSETGQKARTMYLLQWETMRWARAQGCESYDMWGAPDDPDDKSDPLSGVYYFKQGFGGRHVRMAGVYDYVVHPFLYTVWQQALPRYIGLLRSLRGERLAPAGAALA